MDLFEHEARDLFERYGVPVPRGFVADTPESAREAAARLGGTVVVKAQVKTGGRGKAGGIKLASTPDEAFMAASAILGMDIKGHTVHKVLVTEASEIAEEYYLSFLLDRANRTFIGMASATGKAGGKSAELTAVEQELAKARKELVALQGNGATKGGAGKKGAAKIAKGSGAPNRDKVAKVTRKQLVEIAEMKAPDLNANDIDAAVAIIAGTARSMGIDVEG